jgi:hypothetical protein
MALEAAITGVSIPACRHLLCSGTRQRSESLGRLTSSTTSARDDKLRVKIHEWLSKLRSLACRLPHAVTFFEAERVSVPKASEDSRLPLPQSAMEKGA